jgi:hypothetical protein
MDTLANKTGVLHLLLAQEEAPPVQRNAQGGFEPQTFLAGFPAKCTGRVAQSSPLCYWIQTIWKFNAIERCKISILATLNFESRFPANWGLQ